MPYTEFTTTVTEFHDYEVGDIISWGTTNNQYRVDAVCPNLDHGEVRYDLTNVKTGRKFYSYDADPRFTEKVVAPKTTRIRFYVDLDVEDDYKARIAIRSDLEAVLPEGNYVTYVLVDDIK